MAHEQQLYMQVTSKNVGDTATAGHTVPAHMLSLQHLMLLQSTSQAYKASTGVHATVPCRA